MSTVRTRQRESVSISAVLTCIFTGAMCLMMLAWEVRYQYMKAEAEKVQKELQKTFEQIGKTR